jgi:hypothetical protein
MDPGSIDDLLGEDHARIGSLLKAFSEAWRSGSPDAPGLLRRIDQGLRAHIRWEEEALFPAVRERATAAERRSIESLEIDHVRIGETLEAIAAALASAGDVAGPLDRLEIYLKGHNYDEEHGVYVEADRYLTPEERRRLLERFSDSA